MNREKSEQITVIEEDEKYLDDYGIDEPDDPEAINRYLDGKAEQEESLNPVKVEPVHGTMGRVAVKTTKPRRDYID